MFVDQCERVAHCILTQCKRARSNDSESIDYGEILKVLVDFALYCGSIASTIAPEARQNITRNLSPQWRDTLASIFDLLKLVTATPSSTTASSTIPSSKTPASTTPSSTTPSSTIPSSKTPASTTPSSTTPASTTPASTTPSSATPSSTTHIETTSDHVSKKSARQQPKLKVDPIIANSLETWTKSPEKFFDQDSIPFTGLCDYALRLEKTGVVNIVRLRFVKLLIYLLSRPFPRKGKGTLYDSLVLYGLSIKERTFNRWRAQGETYNFFVEKWGDWTLLVLDLTATDAEQFPKNEDSIASKLAVYQDRGIGDYAEQYEKAGTALMKHAKTVPILAGYVLDSGHFLLDHATPQQTSHKRKPSEPLTHQYRRPFCTDKTLVGYPLQPGHASSPVITGIRNVVERGEADAGNPHQLSPSPTVYSEGTAMSTNDTGPGTTSHLQARDLSSQRRYQSVPLPTMPSHATRVPRLNPVLASLPRPALNNRISPPTIQTQPNSPVIQSYITESSSLGRRAGSWDELQIQTPSPSPSPGLQPNQQSEAPTAHQPVLSSSGPRGEANAITDDIGPNSMPDSSMQGLPLIQSRRHGLSHGAAETHHPHRNCSPPQPPTTQMASDSTAIQRQVARASSSAASPESNQVMVQEPPSNPPSYQRSKACIPSHPAPPTSPNINSAPAEQGQLQPSTTPPIPMAAEITGVPAGISANRSSLSEFCPENAESQDCGETNDTSSCPHSQALQDRESPGANVNPHSTRNSAMTQVFSSPQPCSSASDVSKEGAPINTRPSPGPQPENVRFDGHSLPNEASRNSVFPQGPQNGVPGSHPSQWSPERITIGSFLDPLSGSQHITSTQQQWWALEPRLPDDFTDPRFNDAFLEPGTSLNMDTALDTSIDWDALGREILTQIPDTSGKELFENSGDAAPL